MRNYSNLSLMNLFDFYSNSRFEVSTTNQNEVLCAIEKGSSSEN